MTKLTPEQVAAAILTYADADTLTVNIGALTLYLAGAADLSDVASITVNVGTGGERRDREALRRLQSCPAPL